MDKNCYKRHINKKEMNLVTGTMEEEEKLVQLLNSSRGIKNWQIKLLDLVFSLTYQAISVIFSKHTL